MKAKALAHPNIALIKYWGNRDHALRLPVNGSISMNLASLYTITSVTFDPALDHDNLSINSTQVVGEALSRVTVFLDLIRSKANCSFSAHVISENNFPIGAGIASSSAAFSALALAGSAAAGLKLTEKELSVLARHGSGSACRSIPSGYVEWSVGTKDEDSFAQTIAAPGHWDLVDIIAVVDQSIKKTGSTEGHKLARSSPFQDPRVNDAPRRLDVCRRAIQERDFSALADVVEQDSNMMHAVMMTSVPPLYYMLPSSFHVIQNVIQWRSQGMCVCFTMDAGPNVHILCPQEFRDEIINLCKKIYQVKSLLISGVGPGAELLSES